MNKTTIKISVLAFLGFMTYGYAQQQQQDPYKGKVGINTVTPSATMDVQPNSDNARVEAKTNEGIIAPKLSKTRIANIETPVEGTLVYATDDATSLISAYTGNDPKVAKITEKGYYYYNGTEWVKAGSDLNTDEFIPTDITDVYGETFTGVKLIQTSTGKQPNRSLFAISDTGGLYIKSDGDKSRIHLYGLGNKSLDLRTLDNVSSTVATIIGGSEAYGQLYIGTKAYSTNEETLWSIQNVGVNNATPEVAKRRGDLGIRYGTSQIALFKKEGKLSIGGLQEPKATLVLSSSLGQKYKTFDDQDRYDVLHLHESNNSAYGFGIHNSTLEIYGNDINQKVQIGKRSSDGNGIFTPNVTFLGSGNVGIGIQIPSEKLDVAGNIKSSSLASNAGNRHVYADANGVLKIGTNDVTTLASLWTEDVTNNSIKLAVNSDGSTRSNVVSILDDGKVHASSFMGTNGATIFPDYVFQKYYTGTSSIKADYHFKSLSQVEDFVKTNGHLPGYKSAETIKAQGYVDLMETQLTNVEKIEELYLHSIEQDKVNKQQAEVLRAKESKIQELEAKNAALESRLERLEKFIQ